MKKTITLSLASVMALGFMSFGVISSTGITGKTTTGCTCHSSAANAGVTVSLTSPTSTLFSVGYTPGNTYTLNLLVQETGKVKFGLDVKASSGTLAAGPNGDTQKLGTEITHTGTGNSGTTSHAFDFLWTAPASGSVTFTFAGNATNGNGTDDTGDHWNKGSVVVSSATGISENSDPTINLSVFPNPVSESANIFYELASKSVVSATLINMQGQAVTTFFSNEEQTAGIQDRSLTIEPSIAKGIYFVAMNVNGKKSYKKIVVQ